MHAILIVEDEPLLLLDGMCLFESEGFEAIPSANAAEAICTLEERSDIAVVVTDIGMPGAMDGLTLCETIRQRWPEIELIVTSGRQAPKPDELPDRCLFLPKPYDVPALLKALHGFAGDRTPA